MGRFDLGRRIAGLLPRYGVTVDSSIVPLRCVAGGPDHFLAPVDPYFPAESSSDRRLLEVPLTLVSIFPGLPERLYGMAATLRPRKTDFLLNAFRYAAVVGIQPAWFPLESMKTAVRLHQRRGGRVLAMFLHSSELYPGASPKFRTKAAVDRLLDRLRAFLNWLARTVPVDGVVLSGLHPCLAAAGEKRPDAVEADRR
jgi:hypothetical protein